MALALVCAAPAAAAGTSDDSAGSSSSSLSVPDHGLAPRDVRKDEMREPAEPVSAAAGAAQAKLQGLLGDQGLVEIDPLTGTPRIVAKLDGFLTGPSDASPKAIALGYLRDHATAFGLDAGDIASLELTHSYTDVRGTTHLIWAQVFDGVRAHDNGVYANVTEDGRLVNLMGSPVSDLGVRTTQPDVSARGALSTALGNAGVPASDLPSKVSTRGTDSLTRFAGGDDARLVLFTEGPGVTRLAWRITAEASSTEVYDYVVDASTGDVLYRENTVDFATGRVWEYAPNLNSVCAGCGAAAGAQTDHNFGPSGTGWNTQTDKLQGSNAHVYTDINDDDQVDTPSGNCPECGEIAPNNLAGPAWTYNFFPNPGNATFETGFDCGATFPQCSWYLHNPGFQGWRPNIDQNSTQVYWFVNNFHDHLENTPAIGFNNASGNFEGVDAVQAQTFDGANTETGGIPGTPDNDHVNNANMATPKDGQAPKMQMYLFYQPGTQDVQTNGGDDATVMYHEYTHGLSNRLVLDTSGAPALKSFQARSMGEGWSDWYALDYLEGQNLDEDDTALDGQMNMAVYTLGGDIHSLRTEGLDCQVGSSNTTDCPGGDSTGTGGYTLGDMGHVTSGPEVHADGEIWAQAIWDLRHDWIATSGLPTATALAQIRTIVTDGMRLSVPDPSMLDMRNAIVQATTTDFPGNATLRNFVWQTFADRGMGYFASDQGSSDTSPNEDFNTPPNCGVIDCGVLTGRVTNTDTGAPVANAKIAIRGAGDLVATTNATGNYTINNVPPHTYDQLTGNRAGFNPVQRAGVAVGTDTTTLNLTMRRDWAAINGGGQVVSFSPPDYTAFGCGPSGAFDLSLGSGWGSTSLNPVDPSNGPGGAKSVVVKLPAPIDLAGLAVDPGATCGDDDNASTKTLRIQTSPNNSTYTTVAQTNFGAAANHHLNAVIPSPKPKKVRYVRATMLANQNPSVGSGRNFMDLSELQVYGKPSDITKPVIGNVTIPAGQTVRSIIANGFKIRAALNEAGTMKGTLLITATKAQQLGIPRQIGTGTLAFTAAATKTMTMNLTTTAKNKLQNQNNLAVTATLNATDKAGNKAAPVSRSTTLPH